MGLIKGSHVAKKPPAKAKPKAAAAASKKAPSKPAAKPAPKQAKSKPAAKAAKAAPKPKAAKPAKAVKAAAPAKSAKIEAKAKTAAPAKAAAAAKSAEGAASDAAKAGRKGITVVAAKAVKKPVAKPPVHSMIPASVGRLLDPKNPIRRPLIPSGPKAAHVRPLGSQMERDPEPELPKAKTPFNKKELEHYRQKLIRKRAELVGDVATMESQALRGQSGALSNLPQHMAEQGSEAYDQSLSLDLAAADRKLIKEIDDALARIAAGTFGICIVTGKPIGIERLEELPWASLSIEAARAAERPMGRM